MTIGEIGQPSCHYFVIEHFTESLSQRIWFGVLETFMVLRVFVRLIANSMSRTPPRGGISQGEDTNRTETLDKLWGSRGSISTKGVDPIQLFFRDCHLNETAGEPVGGAHLGHIAECNVRLNVIGL
jgi:hypothetical protein